MSPILTKGDTAASGGPPLSKGPRQPWVQVRGYKGIQQPAAGRKPRGAEKEQGMGKGNNPGKRGVNEERTTGERREDDARTTGERRENDGRTTRERGPLSQDLGEREREREKEAWEKEAAQVEQVLVPLK